MIYERQPDGRVLVDREMLATCLKRTEASIRGFVRRRFEPAGYLDDHTVADRRHRRRAVYDLDAVTAAVRAADALLDVVAHPPA